MSPDVSPGAQGAPPREADVVVLGAGPTGLAAAWELVDAGASVVLVEAADAAGGLCRSHERRGFYFDQGGHRFITRNRELFQRVKGLLGDDLRVRERDSVIRIDGREYRYPLALGEVVRGEGAAGIARLLLSYVLARVRSAVARRRDGSLESWVRSRFGGAIFERFFRDYTRKLWGMGADRIAADWAGQRISTIGLGDVVRSALGAKVTPRTFAVRYSYPRHGIGQIFERVARAVVRGGGSILVRSRATRVRASTPLEVEVRTPSGTAAVRARRLISTIPLPDLAVLLDLPEEARSAAARLRFRGLRFVNLLLEGPHLSSRTWIYVPEARFPMTRVQFPASRSPDNCPPGKTSVQLEVPCDEGDEVWSLSDLQIVERCVGGLRELGFDVEERILDTFTTFAPHAYPVYDHDYRRARETVLAAIERLPGVETCGRQGSFDYMFFDRAMEQGIRAARRFLGKPLGEDYACGRRSFLPEEAHSLLEEGSPAGRPQSR